MTASATVRVFVPTYRRSTLLARALASLRAQTMQDWVCEVHNDDPDDAGPASVVAACGDARILFRPHGRNLGAVKTFNLFYRATAEPFYAILEDDNWWQPRFLEEMLAAMSQYSGATVAWCNQAIWEELPDGAWRDSGRTVNPLETDATPRLIQWGSPAQALGARHANGAMLIRSRPGDCFTTPAVPQAGIEPFRERLFPYPLLYVPAVLACFSVTRATSRSDDRAEWSSYQTALLGTFVRHARMDTQAMAALWRHYAAGTPPPTNVFLFAGLLWPESRPFLAMAGWEGWGRLFRHALGHPQITWQVLRTRTRCREWCETLDRATAARFEERRGHGTEGASRDRAIRAAG